MRISATLVEAERICRYIPVVSTVSAIVVIFLKCVCKCLPQSIANNRFWTHIQEADLSLCLISGIPVFGNIHILVDDYYQYKKDKESLKETQMSTARMLVPLARQTSGEAVTPEQLLPAATEDQQRLWMACLGNDAQPIRELLNKGISPNFYHLGNTPLVTACEKSTTEIIQLLINAGAEVNTSDRFGNSPFSAACTSGNLEVVQLLRPHVPDINAPTAKGVTSLMFASAGGHANVVQYLIAQGADRNRVVNGSDAVTCAMAPFDHAHILQYLFGENENIDDRRYELQLGPFEPRYENLTPLVYAALTGRVNSAMYLVQRSNLRLNNMALHYSVRRIQLLGALLQKCHTPEFVNHQLHNGSTALHKAISLDQPEAALLLLQYGADPLIQNQEGKTPLVLACEKDLVNVVAYIQLHHANRITPAIQEQVTAANQAAVARRGQPPQPQPARDNVFASSLRLMQTALDMRIRLAQQEEELGPVPRTGMELLLGRLV